MNVSSCQRRLLRLIRNQFGIIQSLERVPTYFRNEKVLKIFNVRSQCPYPLKLHGHKNKIISKKNSTYYERLRREAKSFLWRMTTNVKAPRLLFHSMRAQDDFLYCQPHLHSVQNYNTSIYLFSKQKSRQTFICQKTVKVFHLKICLVAFVSFDSISVKSHPNSRKVIKIKM